MEEGWGREKDKLEMKKERTKNSRSNSWLIQTDARLTQFHKFAVQMNI